MTTREYAIAQHKKGYNCAQSVLTACGECTGMDEKTALAISAGFGGGLRCGEICGAASGAMMAIGLCNPYNDCENLEAKDKIAALAKEFTKCFQDAHGNLRCVDLKAGDCDCNELIAFSAEQAIKMINENK